VQLDTIGNSQAVPSERHVAVVCDGFIRARAEGGRERLCDFSLERIAGDIPHLGANRVEALSFALPDLDREELQQVPVSVRRAGACSFWPVQ